MPLKKCNMEALLRLYCVDSKKILPIKWYIIFLFRRGEPNTTVCGCEATTESTDEVTSESSSTEATSTSISTSSQIHENESFQAHCDCSCTASPGKNKLFTVILFTVIKKKPTFALNATTIRPEAPAEFIFLWAGEQLFIHNLQDQNKILQLKPSAKSRFCKRAGGA